MSFWQTLKKAVFNMATGFFATFFLLAALLIFYHLDQEEIIEWEGIPIIDGLTNTYLEGWEIIKTAVATKSDSATLSTKNKVNKRVDKIRIPLTWEREEIEEKLKQEGFTGGKLEKAKVYLEYIDANKKWALQDMYYYGVLASTKMAQALLESNAGNSRLAKNTNNHFGIKARHSSQAREKIRKKQYHLLKDEDFVYQTPAIGVFQMHDDYKYDRFEKYNSVENSFQRHTALLTRDCYFGKIGCYQWIWKTFNQCKTYDIQQIVKATYARTKRPAKDYFGGQTEIPYYAAAAVGLKISGYATAKNYHKHLSYIIETYELWRLDVGVWMVKVGE